jgi:hypothetical protein
MPARKYLTQAVWSWSSTFPNVFIVSWATFSHAEWIGKRSDLSCAGCRMDNSFSTVSKHIKQWAVIEFLTYENETPISIYQRLLAWRYLVISTVCCWVRKSRENGRNWDLNNHVQCGRPVGVFLSLNSKSLTNLFSRINIFLREPYQKS